ncbi:MAG: response regulator transcription factor [Oscillospiraceae bacterium]|nr:response regulator transcription factor [Oscillospiraceae bacterium]
MPDCLIIDDEVSIAQTVSEYFGLFNLTCEYAVSYDEGMTAIHEMAPSIVLLDINLGGESGFSLCKKIRETSQVPILFISARNTDDDLLAALGIGGDDYITKPFSMAVLLAKVKAILKRSRMQKEASTDSQPCSGFGNVSMDRNTGRVYKEGALVKLKPMEWKLLLYLTDNRGRTLTKDELLENVWQDAYIAEGTLSVHIRHLREKLEDDPNVPAYIKTIWGSGYLFEVDG